MIQFSSWLICIPIVFVDANHFQHLQDTQSKLSETGLSNEGHFVRVEPTCQQVSSSSTSNEKPAKSTSRLSERAKKKSWYNVIYPNYKSRAEDFKKLFKDVPNDERLIVGKLPKKTYVRVKDGSVDPHFA